ncbi:MAG: GNAT family N-acetyltransferase [Gammaproteobacteria bacterium]
MEIAGFLRSNLPFQSKRRKDWVEVDAKVYQEAYRTYGGSIATHPVFLEALSGVVGISTVFLAKYENGKLLGAIPVWGAYLAGSKTVLKKAGVRGAVDLGNSEVILPLSKCHEFDIGYIGEYLSSVHKSNITNLKPMKGISLCMAKRSSLGGFSSKFLYNRRRELRNFMDGGGEVRSVEEVSNREFVRIYGVLFRKRFGKSPKGIDHLESFLHAAGPYLHGSVLFFSDKPIALQLVYRIESVHHVSVEFVNGGYDPEYGRFSPGSVLTFINTRAADEKSAQIGKPLRYSFGISDADYKMRWCTQEPVFSIK